MDIINFFNNNAFLTSIICIIISSTITILINLSERKKNRNETKKQIEREELINRGEFRTDDRLQDEYINDLNVIFTDYKTEKNKYKINYIKQDCKNLDCIHLSITNIGKSPISELYIVVNNRDRHVLVSNDSFDFIKKNNALSFVVSSYKKILHDESILIKLNYMKYSEIFGTFSSELSLYYRDDYGNFYKQPLFLDENRLEGPYTVKYEEYKKETDLSYK